MKKSLRKLDQEACPFRPMKHDSAKDPFDDEVKSCQAKAAAQNHLVLLQNDRKYSRK